MNNDKPPRVIHGYVDKDLQRLKDDDIDSTLFMRNLPLISYSHAALIIFGEQAQAYAPTTMVVLAANARLYKRVQELERLLDQQKKP